MKSTTLLVMTHSFDKTPTGDASGRFTRTTLATPKPPPGWTPTATPSSACPPDHLISPLAPTDLRAPKQGHDRLITPGSAPRRAPKAPERPPVAMINGARAPGGACRHSIRLNPAGMHLELPSSGHAYWCM
jgi:hypothetical protein